MTKVPSSSGYKRWVNHPTALEGFTPLHIASFKGSIDVISALVDAGADINIVTQKGIDVLHVAAQGDQASSIIYFLEANLNINNVDKRGSSPLHWAIYSNSEVAASYLLAQQAQVNIQDIDGNTPLHLSIKIGYQQKNTRICKLLLLQGADRDIRNKSNKRAMDLLFELAPESSDLRTQFIKLLVAYL